MRDALCIASEPGPIRTAQNRAGLWMEDKLETFTREDDRVG